MAEITHDMVGLSRTQRRRMERAADLVDRVAKADAAFFARRPDRSHRLRLMSAAERQQLAIMNNRDDVPPAPGKEWIVVVRQVAPGARVRRFLTIDCGLDLDQNEATCEAVYQHVTAGSTEARRIEASLRAAMEGKPNG